MLLGWSQLYSIVYFLPGTNPPRKAEPGGGGVWMNEGSSGFKAFATASRFSLVTSATTRTNITATRYITRKQASALL